LPVVRKLGVKIENITISKISIINCDWFLNIFVNLIPFIPIYTLITDLIIFSVVTSFSENSARISPFDNTITLFANLATS